MDSLVQILEGFDVPRCLGNCGCRNCPGPDARLSGLGDMGNVAGVVGGLALLGVALLAARHVKKMHRPHKASRLLAFQRT